MKERTQTGGQAISGLFTMLLFLVFVLCALLNHSCSTGITVISGMILEAKPS